MTQTPNVLYKGGHALVNAYRELGHFVAAVDPLGHNRPHHPLLEIAEYGLSTADFDRPVGRGASSGPRMGACAICSRSCV